ncbi:MAG: hypothetical protein AAF846_14520 [Chloroflexota bacterium]
MKTQSSPTVASITRRTVLCLTVTIAIFAIISTTQATLPMSIVLVVAFVLLGAYALNRVRKDLS